MNRNEKAPVEVTGAHLNSSLGNDTVQSGINKNGPVTANLEGLLSRLEEVKQIPAKKHVLSFTALCPAHADKNPSLCVDLMHNRRILLFCRAGCGGAEILAAIGLSLADLYPNNDFKRPPGYTSKEIDYALTVAQVAEKYRRNGRKPKPTDLDLINQALKVLHFTKKQIIQELRHGI